MSQSLVKAAILFALSSWLGGFMETAARAEGDDTRIARTATPVLLNTEQGTWRVKAQLVYEASTKTLTRRTYIVWDTMASRGLDFVWTPDAPAADRAGRVTGEGRLSWRISGKPSYDLSAVYAEYRGRMRDGRPEGQGAYTDRSGLSYQGGWTQGLAEGEGDLKLADGAEYVGHFHRGKADGRGRFFDIDGEVFDGDFRGGLRNGAGATLLPNGRSYRSVWSLGEEIANSRKIRLAQLGAVTSQASDDIRLGVVVQRLPASPEALGYVSSNSEAGLSITPDNKRLMGLWKGSDEIQLKPGEDYVKDDGSFGVFGLKKPELPPLTLTLEVQNRAAAPLQVVGAYVDVETSASDLQPAIQMSGGRHEACVVTEHERYNPQLEVDNFGWSAAQNPRLRFAFANPKAQSRPSSFALQKSLGAIASVLKIDFEPELRAAGVDIATLRKNAKDGFKCKSSDPSQCLAELAASGTFGRVAGNIALDDINIRLSTVGFLDYVWVDQNGVSKNRTSPFNAQLSLGQLYTPAECGEGGERQPLNAKPLALKLDQAKYRVPVAFERTIPAGQTARYGLSLTAAKSSQHKFKVVVQLADGREITSRPISLLYFVPNWGSQN